MILALRTPSDPMDLCSLAYHACLLLKKLTCVDDAGKVVSRRKRLRGSHGGAVDNTTGHSRLRSHHVRSSHKLSLILSAAYSRTPRRSIVLLSLRHSPRGLRWRRSGHRVQALLLVLCLLLLLLMLLMLMLMLLLFMRWKACVRVH